MERQTRGRDLWGENPGVFFCPWVGEIWGPFLVCSKGFAPLLLPYRSGKSQLGTWCTKKSTR